MGKLEFGRKGPEGLKGETDEKIIGDNVEQEAYLLEEEKLSFDQIMKRLTMSKEEILKEDTERAKKKAKEWKEKVKEGNDIVENSKKELDDLTKSIEDIFG